MKFNAVIKTQYNGMFYSLIFDIGSTQCLESHTRHSCACCIGVEDIH